VARTWPWEHSGLPRVGPRSRESQRACAPTWRSRSFPGRRLLVGVAIFLVLAPLLAVARQATLLGIAGLVGAFADLVEGSVLPHLPVDPVYGGAGLRLLGSIEPRGLAVAGVPGLLLHTVMPAAFLSPIHVADGAAVSALVEPGVTVLARVLAALLATAVLFAVASGLARRMQRPSLHVTRPT
jgi:hypothetical protein